MVNLLGTVLDGAGSLHTVDVAAVLTAAAGMSGNLAVAAAALQELHRVQPNISLAWIANQMPIKADADRIKLNDRASARHPGVVSRLSMVAISSLSCLWSDGDLKGRIPVNPGP